MIGAAAALGLVGGPVASAIASPNQAHVHATGQSRGEVQRYWTPRRMRHAKPMKLALPLPAESSTALSVTPDGPPALIPGRTRAAARARSSSTGTDSESNPAEDANFPNRVHGK